MSHLPVPDSLIDLPTEPPVDCTDPMLWLLGRRILADHERGVDGYCVICRPHDIHPCEAIVLAIRGMRAASPDSVDLDAIDWGPR